MMEERHYYTLESAFYRENAPTLSSLLFCGSDGGCDVGYCLCKCRGRDLCPLIQK